MLKKNISSYLNILVIFFKLTIFIRILFSLARTIIFDDRIEYVIIVIIRLLTNLFEQHLKWERDLKRRDVIYIYIVPPVVIPIKLIIYIYIILLTLRYYYYYLI